MTLGGLCQYGGTRLGWHLGGTRPNACRIAYPMNHIAWRVPLLQTAHDQRQRGAALEIAAILATVPTTWW